MLKRPSAGPQETRAATPTRWGAGLLAVLAVFGLGAVAGRATAPDAAATPTQDEAPAEPSAGEEARGPGPSRVQNGVPLGYAHTEDGAVAAAVQYATLLGGRALLNQHELARTLRTVAADASRDDLERRFGEAAQLMRERLNLTDELLDHPGSVWRSAPAGWEIRAYDRSTATVAVWATGVVMIPGRSPIQPGWKTTEVDLAWERSDWRLVGFRTEDGPGPPAGDRPDQGLAGQRINELNPLWYLPPSEG